jgi:isoleucyl-tRNA synthetase
MFNPVSSRVNFPQIEEKILAWWKSDDVFQQSLGARQGGPLFVLYEGPPTANGSPGIHHVLARIFKDVIPRYKVMKGYYAPRIAGWDTHGLPVELEVERELGFSGKAQIEEYGIDKFNTRCRESVFRYLREWNELTERIGFWIDLEHPYITMNNSYIESVWWAIKQMWDKERVYQGYKVTPHCPRCGTSLSSHEVALGYRDDTEDPSVYIKFKIDLSSLKGSGAREQLSNLLKSSGKPAYLLAWTTTPWTLPGNTALAVNPEAEYVVLEGDEDYLIVANRRVEAMSIDNYQIIHKIEGKELAGEKSIETPEDIPEILKKPGWYRIENPVLYEPLYQVPIARYKDLDKPAYRVIEGDFVSMEDGTGIVHIAPAYGEIDFEVGEQEGLPLVHTIGLDGLVKTDLPYALTPELQRRMRLGVATSNFPTGITPETRQEILEGEISAIRQPGASLPLPGAGKFVKDADPLILEDLQRRNLLFRSETIRHTYPFCWRCESPLLYYAKQTWYIRTTAVKDSLISGNNEINWYPDHIKYGRFGDWLQNNVDWAFSRERYWGTPLPVWRCESCGEPECVGGVKELKEKPGFSGLKEPLDLHRPFVDEVTFDCPRCGKKMRRVPEVIDCWFDSGAMPFAQWHHGPENQAIFHERFPADYICEAVDQTRGWFYSLHAISTLLFARPCFRNVICLGHILDAAGEKMSKAKGNVVQPSAVIDRYGADALRWYLFTSSPPGNVRRFDEKMVAEVSRRFLSTLWNVYSFFIIYANIDNYIPGAGTALSAESELDRWIISELNQLIADVDSALDGYNPTEAGRKIEGFVDGLSNWYVRRSRRRFWKSENDADKLSAYHTLYVCLVALAKLLAPFIPFLAEELYRNLVRSVFPEAPESVHLTDFPVADKSQIDRQLTEDNRLAMKVASMGRAARAKAGIKVRQPLAVNYVGVSSEWEKRALKRLEPLVLEELNVKELRYDSIENVAALEGNDYVVVGEAANNSAVCTSLTPELRAEGMAREVVHRLQTMRRSAGFDIADHILTYYQGEAYVGQVMADFADYIRQETLSRELVAGIPEGIDLRENYKLGGYNVLLGVKRLE